MGVVAVGIREAGAAATGGDTLPPATELGGQGGEIFAAVALIYLLAYLDLYLAADHENRLLRRLLQAAILPLLVTFAGIVLFESLTIV